MEKFVNLVLSLFSGLLSFFRWLWRIIIVTIIPSKLIPINPINQPGNNDFILKRKANDYQGTDDFQIRSNFILTPRFDMTIVGVDLTCDVNAMTKGIEVKANNMTLENGYSYSANKDKGITISIWKIFTCKFMAAERYLDYRRGDKESGYGRIQIEICATSSYWSGVKIIHITGNLFAGGKLTNLKYFFHESLWKALKAQF